MKYLAITLIMAAALSLSHFAVGQSKIDGEFAQLKAQHRKEVAQADEPINRRYQAALEQLLRRATLAGDLDGALKIRNELKMVQFPDLRVALNGSNWEWVRPGVKETVQFFSDGTLKHQLFPGTWEPIDAHSIRIKAVWGESQLRFNADFTTFEAVGGLPGNQAVKGNLVQ